MTQRRSAPGQRPRTGAVAAVAVVAGFTLLVFGTAVYVAAASAADHDLDGFAWLAVAWIAILGVVSGLVTAYLGRRVFRDPH